MKKIVAVLTLIFAINVAFAQDIDIKWSEQFIYDNKLDGFFDDFIGSNRSFIYAKFTNLSLNSKKSDKKIKLIAFDKITMKKMGEVNLKGYSDINNDKTYYKTIVLDDIIYVLWTKKTKGTVELFAQSFDSKLKKINKLSKIYEINAGKAGYDNLIVLYNRNLNNRILIAKEFEVTKDDQNLKIEYKFINSDFSLVSSKQVTLPILVKKKRRGIFGTVDSFSDIVCSYELADDGNLYIQDVVRLSEEERKSLKKGEASVYPHLMQVEMESGDLQEYRLKFPRKNTFNFSTLITTNGVKLYGFFSDLEKDEKGKDTHGLFLISLDSKNFKNVDMKFSYFDKRFLDELYANDKENQKKGGGLFKSKKAKESDNESIDDNYIIEKVMEDGTDIVLFCSIMRNWSQTVCTTSSNGAQSCRTYYYCDKSNVTAFKLDKTGDIIWARNMDRRITYNRWNVYDLNVIKKNDDYLVTYGSAFQINAKKKNIRSSKPGKQQTDRLEYAIFSGRNGDYKKNEYQVNKLNVKKAEAKFIRPEQIQVFDNKMYTSCDKYKLKPATYIACLCPPVFYFMLMSGNSRKGTGHLGTISGK